MTAVAHAETAIEMLRARKGGDQFDLVISDVHMPNMDGFKLLELVGLEMDIPVISKVLARSAAIFVYLIFSHAAAKPIENHVKNFRDRIKRKFTYQSPYLIRGYLSIRCKSGMANFNVGYYISEYFFYGTHMIASCCKCARSNTSPYAAGCTDCV